MLTLLNSTFPAIPVDRCISDVSVHLHSCQTPPSQLIQSNDTFQGVQHVIISTRFPIVSFPSGSRHSTWLVTWLQDFRIVLKAEREGVPPDVKLDGMYKHLGAGNNWVLPARSCFWLVVCAGPFGPWVKWVSLEIDAGTARSKLESLPL